MQLAGRLCLTSLGDLLGVLHRGRATGILELAEEGRGHCHRVRLRDGLVTGVETPLGPDLLSVLADAGLPPETVRRCRRETFSQAEQLAWLDQALAERDLRQGLALQARARLDALATLADARIRFRVAKISDPPLNPDTPLTAQSFLYGRERRRDHASASVEAPSRQAASSRNNPVRTRALEVLGLPSEASSAEVQRAFRSLARQAHPDRHPTLGRSERLDYMRRFAEISAAYHSLKG